MRNLIYLFLLGMCTFSSVRSKGQSACPALTASGNTTICGGCTNISATVQGSVATTSYSVSSIPYTPFSFNSGNPILIGIDDEFSDTVNLPFCFEFYGNTYSKCVVGSNGIVNFDITNANNYNTWPINAAVPTNNPTDLMNSIMSPWHDIDPSVGGQTYYLLGGTAPCRYLVVSWYQVPMFSCNNLIATQQIVLYETTNIIDVYIQNKPTCNSWNGGAAIEAVQDAMGTQAVVVPGRNYPSVWTVSNDAYRWTPTGAPQYTFGWYDPNNNLVSTNLTANVCPTSTTTYTAQLVNNTCSGPLNLTATVTITVSNNLSVSTSTVPAGCGNSNGTATVNVLTGSSPYTYLWTPSGQTTSTATGLAPGTYSCQVTDVNGCQITTTVTVTNVNTPPLVTFTGTDTTGCQTLCVTFNNTTANSVTCFWDFGDGNTSTQCNPVHCYSIPGTYSVKLTVTDGNGCTATTVHNNMVTVYAQPVANFSASPTPVDILAPTVHFTDMSTGGVNSWLWNFGDPNNSTSSQQNPNFTYSDTGTYVVTLIVSNGNCIDTIQQTIHIDDVFAFYAPNSFTPDADGKNDVFLPKWNAVDITKYEMMIFDRWGNMIFKTNNPFEGWDGHANKGASLAQQDVYVWKVSLSDTFSHQHKFIGHVSLIK